MTTQAKQSPWALLRAAWKAGHLLPVGSADRKEFPVWGGCDCYFPAALVAIAGLSKVSGDKHHPGQPMHHARGVSTDHEDCQRRHALDAAAAAFVPGLDKLEELTCKAWRACAELQVYAESLGAPPAPAARFPKETK